MEISQGKIRKQLSKVLYYLISTFIGLLFIIPFMWMISTSIKSAADVFNIPIEWIPASPKWSNYPEALSVGNIPRYFLNSILVSSATVLIRLLVCAMAGYGLIKFHFRGREVIFALILATLMIPAEVIIVPLYLTTKSFGWLDTYWGLIIPLSVSAFGVFIMRQHISSIPDDLISSARIDGLWEMGIFFKIILPLSTASLVALAVFTFMESWDNLLWPLIIIGKDHMKTIALGIAAFENSYSTNYGYIMAVSIVATVPIVIAYAFLQKQFVEGITLSGFK